MVVWPSVDSGLEIPGFSGHLFPGLMSAFKLLWASATEVAMTA